MAIEVAPLLAKVFADGLPVCFVFWDGSRLGPEDGPGSVAVRSADLLRRLVWSPDELGLVRGFVAGELDLDGDAFEVLRALEEAPGAGLRLVGNALAPALRVARRLGAVGRPPPRPAGEARSSGARHSRARDARSVSRHYDIGNDFYRLVLGPSMTYSCARFESDAATLEDAQTSKHEMICRKLGLGERPGVRLLDVGCGWGSMAIHAAAHHGARVVGITLSPAQARSAREAAARAGLGRQVEIRLQDYRELGAERFDAISSVGMFEHVGGKRAAGYFGILRGLLSPGGRLLNHAISRPGGAKLHGRTFMNRYVFPDGELIDVAEVVREMERAGLEVRDVESLREHYSKTLHEWVGNLRRNWREAVDSVGSERARTWWLYMVASANGFDAGRLAVHQVLGVVPDRECRAGMPPTRRSWG
ncbi:MAG TPA: class I SAM-dependent methyltransferase [Acidimicrobiales bacterium]|nr:class I SAM-dependent methyltransferase [Acidimicrobiales bacterium]